MRKVPTPVVKQTGRVARARPNVANIKPAVVQLRKHVAKTQRSALTRKPVAVRPVANSRRADGPRESGDHFSYERIEAGWIFILVANSFNDR